jgi:hypothetical protein
VANLSRGGDSDYYEETRALLDRAYLAAEDPRMGYEVAGEAEATDTNGAVLTRVAWTSLPEA